MHFYKDKKLDNIAISLNFFLQNCYAVNLFRATPYGVSLEISKVCCPIKILQILPRYIRIYTREDSSCFGWDCAIKHKMKSNKCLYRSVKLLSFCLLFG